jgi:hypothetical protein
MNDHFGTEIHTGDPVIFTHKSTFLHGFVKKIANKVITITIDGETYRRYPNQILALKTFNFEEEEEKKSWWDWFKFW